MNRAPSAYSEATAQAMVRRAFADEEPDAEPFTVALALILGMAGVCVVLGWLARVLR